MSEHVLITGAVGGIGRAVAAQLAQQGDALVLAGRDEVELERTAADLRLRHNVEVTVRPFDALAYVNHAGLVDDCECSVPLDGAVLCHGYMAEQPEAEADFAEAHRMIEVNYSSYISLLSVLADRFQQRGRGYLCAVSSVAGDRGRQSNFIYGSSKAALTTYMQGLRNRLFRHDVSVITINPGFVDTRMTRGKLNPASPMVASPERVARDIVRAIRRRRSIVYTPWFWRPIMLVIRLIPERLFMRLKL